MINQLKFGEADTRVRRPVWPVRVVKTWGKVENVENLLKPGSLQIAYTEYEYTTLKNDGEGEEAAMLLDFGQEIHGAARLLTYLIFGERYADVQLTFGESAAEALSTVGVKNATNDHTPRDMRVLVPSYSDQEIGETGFRFVYLRLLSPNTTLLLKTLGATVIYRDLPYLGSFSCNDEQLNRIYDVCAYTCHLSMQKKLWDGIKRDRLVWVGDMHPEMLTIRTVFGCCGAMEDAIRFARESTPLPRYMSDMPAYSMWWLILVHDWYVYSGDEAFLAEHKPYALALMRQLAAQIGDDGSDAIESKFLDWSTNNLPCRVDGVRALLAWSMGAAAVLADLYGDGEAAALCRQKQAALKACTFDHRGAKPSAAIMSMAGVADSKAMADFLREDGAKGFSTFMSYYMLKAVAKESVTDALSLLRTYYGAMLDVGATTFFEDFNMDWVSKPVIRIDELPREGVSDVHGDNGAYCYEGFRHSLCHGWSSAPAAFLAEEVLGVHIADVGCRVIELAPCLGDLEWAKGAFPTPHGVLSVRCERTADGVAVEWDAPDGVTVTLKN